jgi:thiamine transporter ThiT
VDTQISWFALATQKKTVMRSLKVATLVGTLLMIINHGDIIVTGNITLTHLLKILLTYVVPFLVSTYSSVESQRTTKDHY